MTLRRTTWMGGAAAVAILVAYSVGRADSPFSAGKDPPLIFSGQLSSSGSPLSGSHQIAINLWRATDTSISTNRLCIGVAQTIDVVAGDFQLQLDSSCASAFGRYAQIWYQLVVDGDAFPLQQVGSAPFALSSMREPSNGARLARQRTTLYGDDGFRGDTTFGPLTDTKRNEPCSPTQTAEGIQRCLPQANGTPPSQLPSDLFTDGYCTQPFVPPSTARYYMLPCVSSNNGGCIPPSPPLPYVADLDSAGAVTTIYPATAQNIMLWQNQALGCRGFYYSELLFEYQLGPSIPLTEFVQMQTVTE